jgi:ankyrin repeat protein
VKEDEEGDVEALLEQGGFNLNAVAPKGWTALHIACGAPRGMGGNNEKILASLLALGQVVATSVNHPDNWGYTPMHHCISCVRPEALRMLIESGLVEPASVHLLCTRDHNDGTDAGMSILDMTVRLAHHGQGIPLLDLLRPYFPASEIDTRMRVVKVS